MRASCFLLIAYRKVSCDVARNGGNVLATTSQHSGVRGLWLHMLLATHILMHTLHREAFQHFGLEMDEM